MIRQFSYILMGVVTWVLVGLVCIYVFKQKQTVTGQVAQHLDSIIVRVSKTSD